MATLADRILAPLAGRGDADWLRAPPGKWCPGEIVHHLAQAIDGSSKGFESRLDKPAMARRPPGPRTWLFKQVVLRTGWFGPPRKSPSGILPPTAPDRAATERLLRDGCARFAALEPKILPSRAGDLFLKHPVLGDLTFAEFCVFHERHAAHHLKQIRHRLAQL